MREPPTKSTLSGFFSRRKRRTKHHEDISAAVERANPSAYLDAVDDHEMGT
jgi:hypothetical protein